MVVRCSYVLTALLSAKLMKVIKRSDFFPVFLFYRVRADSVDEGSIGKLGDSVSKSV